jgi:epoxyqueuosine reductase
MTYDDLLSAAQSYNLTIFGNLTGDTDSIILLGPHEPGYWPALCASPEWQDGAPSPVDSWSQPAITQLDQETSAKPHFPFGAQPAPFLTGALTSDRASQSPVRMVVQAEAGLLVSYHGALELDRVISDQPSKNPCPNYAQPCKLACPVGVLNGESYDIDACWSYMREDPEQRCLRAGCLARRACPVSATYPRQATHSAHHMQQF